MYYREMRKAKRAAELALAALLLWAAYWGLRLAWADFQFRKGTEEAQRRAAELVPFNAEYQAAIGNWKRAVELNDYLSEGWIKLGIDAESAGDWAAAERYLLKAASVDRQFEPRWALANFYFRRQRNDDFWKWMRLAAERSYGDRTGFFRLMMRVSQNVSEIADRTFPNDRNIRRDYAAFLIHEGNLEGAAFVAKTLPDDEQSRGLVLELCDKLIHSGRGEQAWGLWRGERALLLNAALATQPLNKGFDWRLHWRAGVNTSWTPGQLRIELSGKQADPVDLVSQYVWIDEPGMYRFVYRYRTDGLARESGVHWTAVGAEGAQGRQHLSSNDWQKQSFEFRTAKPKQVVRLELVYARTTGTVRQEGVVFLEGGMKLERTGAVLTQLK